MDQLRHPAELAALGAPLGRPSLRRDAPFSRPHPQAPRVLPTSPSDIADFINEVGAPGAPCTPFPHPTSLRHRSGAGQGWWFLPRKENRPERTLPPTRLLGPRLGRAGGEGRLAGACWS